MLGLNDPTCQIVTSQASTSSHATKKKPDNHRVNNDFIIYIDETTGQTLADRLRQFNTSAFSERPGHTGGNTFRLTLLETTPLEHPWVSACPVDMDEPYTAAYIKHLERKLIWEFVYLGPLSPL